jgi:hypothetical protein
VIDRFERAGLVPVPIEVEVVVMAIKGESQGELDAGVQVETEENGVTGVRVRDCSFFLLPVKAVNSSSVEAAAMSV